LADCWRALQESNPLLSSPFFAPEFTRAVAEVRDDVEVAVIEGHDGIAGFFPFQRGRFATAEPVGGRLSDYQGLICRQDFPVQVCELLRACRLSAWDFTHLLAAQVPVSTLDRVDIRSPIIDLSDGYEAYARWLNDEGRGVIKRYTYLSRKLAKDLGPVRFVPHSPDPALLSRLLDWKAEQQRRRSRHDGFTLPWWRAVLHCLHGEQSAGFGGILSALYAGDHLLAAHLGLRSRRVWHYWVTCFDPSWAQYSPGLVLLLRMAESAASLGLNVIDLGYGDHEYKRRLMNTAVSLARGHVERPSVATVARRLCRVGRMRPARLRNRLSRTSLWRMVRRVVGSRHES
jgi:CelD/BcsL family acetyltransferase involved in cellulose biosynthesis